MRVLDCVTRPSHHTQALSPTSNSPASIEAVFESRCCSATRRPISSPHRPSAAGPLSCRVRMGSVDAYGGGGSDASGLDHWSAAWENGRGGGGAPPRPQNIQGPPAAIAPSPGPRDARVLSLCCQSSHTLTPTLPFCTQHTRTGRGRGQSLQECSLPAVEFSQCRPVRAPLHCMILSCCVECCSFALGFLRANDFACCVHSLPFSAAGLHHLHRHQHRTLQPQPVPRRARADADPLGRVPVDVHQQRSRRRPPAPQRRRRRWYAHTNIHTSTYTTPTPPMTPTHSLKSPSCHTPTVSRRTLGAAAAKPANHVHSRLLAPSFAAPSFQRQQGQPHVL